MHKYSVALSFAGEDREFAEDIAKELKIMGVSVFYDKYEQHELWGKDLYETLQSVYVKECRYCLLLFSPFYLKKMWTTFERKQIVDRLAHEQGTDCVLPIRIDGFNDDIPGLSRGIGYIDASKNQQKYIADLILKKLGKPGFEVSSSEAFERTLEKVRERRLGYLDVSKIYTSVEVLTDSYESFSNVSMVQGWLGYSFYWKKSRDGSLEIFGKSDEHGLCAICKLKAPDSWVGCGLWEMKPVGDYDPREINGSTELILAIYLFSEKPEDLNDLILKGDDCAFLAGMCLEGVEVESFLKLAEKNFTSLR
jgi:hypothetical protein